MEIIKGTFIVIVIIISFISILLVLIQSSRGGGGLFGDAGGSQSVIGSDRRGDFFSKLTGIFLAIFMGGSLLIAYLEHESNAGIRAPEASSIQEEEESETPTEDTKAKDNEIDIKIDKAPINKKEEDTKTINKTIKPKAKTTTIKKTKAKTITTKKDKSTTTKATTTKAGNTKEVSKENTKKLPKEEKN